MKYILIVLFAVCLASCKKEQQPNAALLKTQVENFTESPLLGDWLLSSLVDEKPEGGSVSITAKGQFVMNLRGAITKGRIFTKAYGPDEDPEGLYKSGKYQGGYVFIEHKGRELKGIWLRLDHGIVIELMSSHVDFARNRTTFYLRKKEE